MKSSGRTVHPNSRALIASALLAALALCASSCAYFTEQPASRALVVGLNAYQNVSSLSYCVADSEAMGDSLSKGGYETRRLAATSSTNYVKKVDVSAALSAAAAEAPVGGWDCFIFYYAGHGYGYSGALAMSDATLTQSSSTSIAVSDLLTAVAAIHAKVRVVILDSCYSGNFVTESPTVSPYPDDYTGTIDSSYPFSFALLEKLASAYSSSSTGDLIVMSAAGAGEASEESAAFGHGIFTAGLLESVNSGDSDGDGLITLSEAYNRAARFVQENWNAIHSSASAYFPRLSGNALDVVLFK